MRQHDRSRLVLAWTELRERPVLYGLFLLWLANTLSMFPIAFLGCGEWAEGLTFLGAGWEWLMGRSACWLCCPVAPAWWS